MIAAAALPHLAVLAAGGTEKSKVPFYIVGSVFAAWAITLGVLGLRRHDFPGTPGRARAVMGVSIALMLAAVSTAVATSSHPGKSLAAGGGKASGNAGQGPGTPNGAASGTGSVGSPGRAGAPTTLSLAADPSGQLHFNTNSLKAKAGRVTIHF